MTPRQRSAAEVTTCRRVGWLFVLLLTAACSASPSASPAPESIRVESALLDATRKVEVYLPRSYAAEPMRHYPVIVLVGGQQPGDIAPLARDIEAEVQAGRMAPVILAAVDVVAGVADLRPEPEAPENVFSSRIDVSSYQQFLATDLLPALEISYRTNGHRALLGGDEAGLFVLDAMYFSPWSFDGWLVLNPALDHPSAWHGRGAAAWLNPYRRLPGRLSILWSGQGGASTAARQLESTFRTRAGSTVRWQFVQRPELPGTGSFRPLALEALAAMYPVRLAAEAVAPSRTPYSADCEWLPFKSAELGVSLWVMNCPGDGRYEFSVVENRVEQHRPADDRIFGSHVVLEMHSKPAAQSIEEALKERFIATLPSPARESCIVERVRRRGFGSDKLLYTLMPTGEYRGQVEADLKQFPRDFGCGPYGKDQATTYFEYHPAESLTRYAYVIYGMDEPLFDERSLVFDGQ